MAFAKIGPTGPLFKPLVLEFLSMLPQKRVINTGGGGILCLVQERKAENEECL